jgi:DNA-binding PadR family transcriptional regulator
VVKVVLLKLLKEKPRYGYEIKKEIEEKWGWWSEIGYSSIYHGLENLEQEGCVRAKRKKIGERPERIVYEITKQGKEKLVKLLRELYQEVERVYLGIDIGVAFMDELPKEEVLKYVKERISRLEKAQAELKELKKIHRKFLPSQELILFSHALLHLEAEITWHKELVKLITQKLKGGAYE